MIFVENEELKQSRKWHWVASKIAAVLLFAALAWLAGCNLCGDEVVSTLSSPGGRYRAVWIVRNCGATTDYVTHVVLERKSLLGWNRESVFVARGEQRLDIRWLTNDALQIDCPSCTPERVFKKQADWNGITVAYKLIE